MRTINYKKEAIAVLRNLQETYPNQLLSTHLSLALAEYPKFDGISDKEFYFIVEKYRCEKELDITPISTDTEIDELYDYTEQSFEEDEY